MSSRNEAVRPDCRPTVALLIDYLHGDYQMSLVEGVMLAAQHAGYNLLVVVGRSLDSSEPNAAAQNEIYRHLSSELLDGVILGAGTVGKLKTPVELAAFCELYNGLPCCSISVPIPGIPSIVVDNFRGSQAIVAHLIEKHSCKRIAYVRGPVASEEAVQRYQGYLAAIEQADIAFDESLVQVGDFLQASGELAMQRWLEEGTTLDAVVAANDGMAVGVLCVLRAQGIAVPHAIRVAGFDDVLSARLASPSLSTVRQPLKRLGQLAVGCIDILRQGRAAPDIFNVDVELVLRQSCGCDYHGRDDRQPPPELNWSEPTVPEQLERNRDALRARLLTRVGIPAEDFSGWPDRLLSTLTAELRGDSSRFLRELEALLREAQPDSFLIERFNVAVRILGEVLDGGASNASHPQVTKLLQSSLLLIADAARRSYLTAQQEATNAMGTIHRGIERLSPAFSHDAIADAIRLVCSEASIARVAISLWSDATRSTLESLIVQRPNGVDLPEQESYSHFLLAPPGFFRSDTPRNYVVMPLTYGNEQLGICVWEAGTHHSIYGALREQIGSALKTASLHRSVVQQTTLREMAERARLQKETAIAQQIQCAILPENFSTPGLQIAARMVPAASVGGDYYDVIPTVDGYWIGFGDVTGHGLLSGLIMLMIQSMVKAAVAATPESKPSDIVVAVNQALFENVHHRLRRDDYATFTLCRLGATGTLTFSGAHESLLLLRKDQAQIEELMSPGIWLGMYADVRPFAKDRHAQLGVGDLLVLYSDGITEAMNGSREQFGVERLAQLIEKNRELDVDEICFVVLRQVQQWALSQLDDMTILVARFLGDATPH